jgi:hypothetical protein
MSTITRKPSRQRASTPPPSEAEIEALIHQGLSKPAAPASAPPEEEDDEQQVVLRLPRALLRRIDVAVKQRPLKTPRHRWLVEAILEKLERESK